MLAAAVAVHPFISVTVMVAVPAHKPVLAAVVGLAPDDHAKVFPPFPPAVVTVAVPSHAPKQVTLVCALMAATNEAGSLMICVTDAVHPAESVTVIPYVSPPNVDDDVALVSEGMVVAVPSTHVYVNVPVPPVPVTEIEPSLYPKQVTSLELFNIRVGPATSFIQIKLSMKHPFASVTVTV